MKAISSGVYVGLTEALQPCFSFEQRGGLKGFLMTDNILDIETKALQYALTTEKLSGVIAFAVLVPPSPPSQRNTCGWCSMPLEYPMILWSQPVAFIILANNALWVAAAFLTRSTLFVASSKAILYQCFCFALPLALVFVV